LKVNADPANPRCTLGEDYSSDDPVEYRRYSPMMSILAMASRVDIAASLLEG